MAHPQYDKYKSQFLDGVAAELVLVDEYAKFFKARVARKFSERYATNTKLVTDKEFLKTVYSSSYTEDNSAFLIDPAEGKLRDTLNKKIKPKIKEKNWTLDGQEIRDWKDLIAFLRNSYFEQWWEKNKDLFVNLWEQLWDNVDSFEGITINTKKLSTLEFDRSAWGEEEEEIPTFSWDKELSYKIKSQESGYLTLIQKYASGKLFLFSPSFLVKQPHQPAQIHQFPSARCAFLPLKAGITGEDWIVAIVSQNKPNYSWVQAEDQKPMELKESDLQDVLNFIRENENCEVIGTKFRIVQPSFSS